MGDLFSYIPKDILIYKILPLIDGRDGAYLSGTCTFMRKLIRDLAGNHLLSRRIKNHVIHLKSVKDFRQISKEYAHKYYDMTESEDIFNKYFDTLIGRDATVLYHELKNKWFFVNNFYSKHRNYDNTCWDSLTYSFIQKGYTWKLIHYPPSIVPNYCLWDDSVTSYMDKGFCIWLEVPQKS